MKKAMARVIEPLLSELQAQLQWGRDWLTISAQSLTEGSACDLCGGKRSRLLHEWPVGDFWNPAAVPIAVWQCTQCSLVFLPPVPTAGQLPDEGDWWSSKRKHFRRRRWFKLRWRKLRHSAVGDPRYRLVRATRRLVKSGRLLDVGCGYGRLMAEARRFYQCTGIEPSPSAARAAREDGFNIFEGTFEEVQIPASSFDIVTMDAVIEHVASPTQVLAKVNSVLRMNGVVVLTTPKFGGPAYRMHRHAWNGFRHGYHTFLFSGTTLAKYLQKTGFEVVRRPKRDRMLDGVLILWGRKTREASLGLLNRPTPEAA
jgi:2-polyprenyl-3-methyl-5-hydroxy-6-metoxy-1,4-benzoquinol methylase